MTSSTKNEPEPVKDPIVKRLDAAVLSVLMVHTEIREQTIKYKISKLNDFGFTYREIANILHTSDGSVANQLSLIKKRTKK